jgi:DNA-binding CsgD family transcriptional regulator
VTERPDADSADRRPVPAALSAGWPLTGRHKELDAVEAALAGGVVAAIIISGPPGVGKTRMVAEALERARASGVATERVTATSSAAAIPLGAFAFLEFDGGIDRLGLLRSAADALVAAAQGRRLVVGIDDAHLLDDVSAALVHHLAASGKAFIVGGIRSGEPCPDAITRLWKDGLAERVELPSLSRAETDELLEAALASTVDGSARRTVWDASHGNPLYLRELVIGALESGALVSQASVWRWIGPLPVVPRLAELLEQRLGTLKASERETLEVVAIAETPSLDLLATLVDVATLEAVERRGLVEEWSHGRRIRVRLTHPLYAELLRAQTPAARARDLRGRLADAVEAMGAYRSEDVLRVATWRLDAGAVQRPGPLVTASRQASAAFDFALGERLAHAAVQAGAGFEGEHALADAMIGRGAFAEAEALLARTECDTDTQRVGCAVSRANNLYWHLGMADLAVATLHDAETAAAPGAARDQLGAARATLLLFEGETERAIALASEVVDRGEQGGAAALQAVMTAGWGLVCAGRLDAALALIEGTTDIAERNSDQLPIALFWLRTSRISALCFAGRFDEGAEAGVAAYDAAVDLRADIPRAMHAFALGWGMRVRGDAPGAVRWLRESAILLRDVDLLRQRSSCLGELAQAEALLGDVQAAEAALAEAEAARVPCFRMDEWAVGLGRTWLAAAWGDTSAAVEHALRTAETTGGLGQRLFQAMALHDAMRLGAPGVAKELAGLAGGLDGALVAAYGRHAVAVQSGEPSALAQASAGFVDLGAFVIAAEVAGAAARAHEQAGDPVAAREWTARAAALADRCAGTTTPALAELNAPAPLTRREREIATLAAHGLSSREIAERLVVSVRTVENHLHNAYGKLGVNDRDQLPPVLGI